MLSSDFISIFPSRLLTVTVKYLEPSHYYDFYCPACVAISESHNMRHDCFDFRLFYDMIKHICPRRFYVYLNSYELVIYCTRSLLFEFHLILSLCINSNVLSAR